MSRRSWKKRYLEIPETERDPADVLVGFNANIDVVHTAEDVDLEDTEPELKEKLSSMDDLKKALKYCIDNKENHEVDKEDFDVEIEGEDSIGGQAGIISNFLAKTGNGTIFYTPLLSEELSQMLEENILYPVTEKKFILKNVRDAANTDRTKKNHIFEFKNGKTGRMIVSDHLKGFGPYFRKGIEDNLEAIDQNINCAIVSGFHDASGNTEAKMKKSASQLQKIDSPVHLEYVHKNRKLNSHVLRHILPQVDSIGLDETELRKISELTSIEDAGEKINLGEAFDFAKKMIERYDLSRVHIHTYRYHLAVLPKNYHCSPDHVKNSMMYGEIAAIQMAQNGEIPDISQIKAFDMDGKHIHDLDELENFGDYFDVDDFSREGIAHIDGYTAVAIPTVIVENPVKTVGMGDIISAASFTSEFKSASR
ncbi:MAG: ADP-dependent glucokinase/phosphofructokinase [Candidatus Nanohaloarchaea archaeon]